MTTDGPAPAAPAPAAPPKQRGPWRKIGVGCLSVLVFGCVAISGVVLYQNRQQEQNYQAGHAAYAQADCASAAEPLRKAASGDPGTKNSDVARKAQAELQECEALLAADALDQQGKSADAVLGYSALMTKYDKSPLKQAALTKGQALVSKAPDGVASAKLCEALDSLAEQQIIAKPADTLPPLLYACGQAYEASGSFSDALVAYARFRSEYPDHKLAGDVRKAFVHATIADAEAGGAGSLPAPQVVGSSDAAGGQATVVIQNDSPDALSVVFSGPDVRVESLEPCADCEKFTGNGPEACPEKGPVGRYVLAPGTYDVVVKSSSGRKVTPFRGSWTLTTSQEYSSCFYVVTDQ